MAPLLPNILVSVTVDPIWVLLLLMPGIVVLVLVANYLTIVEKWIERIRYRNWPTVSAVVDLVSVAYCEPDSLIPPMKSSTNNPYYQATLTYIYRYPEEQMGDYSRIFCDKGEAESWANSYKGEIVNAHVDPRDPTRSVLREEDL